MLCGSKNSEEDGRELFQRFLSAFPGGVSSRIVTSYTYKEHDFIFLAL